MGVTDKYLIREMNERLVLKTFIQNKLISRAEISKVTELNKATVSSIVADLLEKKFIIETGIGTSHSGRKPIMLTLNKEAALSLCIDLGKNHIISSLSYFDGTIVLQKNIMAVQINRRTILKELQSMIQYYLDHAPATTYGIIGICIAFHGIAHKNEVAFSPFYSFENFELTKKLEDMFHIPITLENEANLAAIGEKQHAPELTNLVNINVKTGIGAGIILNGELFTGGSGYAGEVGHMIGVPNGKRCPCGNKGCIEQYASEDQILKTYSRKTGQKDVSFEELKADFLAGKPLAEECVGAFIRLMGLCINNILAAFNPELIIINSRFTNEIDGVIDLLKEQITFKMNNYTRIIPSPLQERAILLGGAYVNVSNFLGIKY